MAATQTQVNPPQHKEVEHFTDAERTEWLKTGEMPPLEEPKTDSPKTDASAASIPAKESGSGPDKKDKPDQERNWRALEGERDTERTARQAAEKELEEWRTGKRQPEKAQPSTATELKAPERPKRPRLDQFSTTDEYETAMDKYEGEMFEFPKKLAEFERTKAQADRRKADFDAKQSKLNNTFKEALKKGKELFGAEWDKAALDPSLPIMDGSPVLEYLGDCEPITAAHLWQYFGLNRKDLERINGLSYRAQMKELAALEEKIAKEISGEPSKAKEQQKEQPKKLTQAGKPPLEAGGGTSSPEDDGSPDAAWRRKDLSPEDRGELYRERMNAAERAKRKRKHN